MTEPVNLVQPGLIVAYAGPLVDEAKLRDLASLGWLPCDGAAYQKRKYPLLALAIGTNFGGTGGARGTFNVPDLRGRFLRGTSYSTGIDPDSVSRKAMSIGGNTGDAVGSLQFSATALPSLAFSFQQAGNHTHNLENVPHGSNAYALVGSHYAIYNSGDVESSPAGDHTHTLENWDNESRPVNVYVNFLIATGDGQNLNVTQPVYGLIAAFGFSLLDEQPAAPWLFCDGSSQSQATFPNLFAAINHTWGPGGDTNSFALPSMRGLFVRGVNPSVSPLSSFQKYSTQLPKNPQFQAALAGDHSHSVNHVPNDTSYYNIAGSHYGWNQQKQSSSANGLHSHVCGSGMGSGGDLETRPVNLYVDFGVLGDVGSDPVTDTFAVGTILPFAGLLNQANLMAAGFLYCDGSPVSRTQFSDLFQAIGTSFGEGDSTTTFNLPDLVGVFPRGVTGSAQGPGYDPDAASRAAVPGVVGGNTGNAVGSYQSSATGQPVNPMITNSAGAHTHTFPNIPTDSSSSAVAGSGQSIWTDDATSTDNSGSHTHAPLSGGDAETRPSSVSCYYLIKYKLD